MRYSSRQILLCFAGLSILALNVCVQTQPDTPLKTMSFNIRYDNPGDGLNAWKNRKDIVAQTISFHKVDICGLQEVLDHQLQDLAGMLPEYAWIGVGRDDGGTQTFNGFNPDLRPDLIIDFIFVQHTGPVINHGIIADRWDGRFVSDHYPVYAEVVISKRD